MSESQLSSSTLTATASRSIAAKRGKVVSGADASPSRAGTQLPRSPKTAVPLWRQTWHVLQLSDALDVEFATALAELAAVTLWEPDRSILPVRPGFQEKERSLPGSRLSIRSFPIIRGYARAPWANLARTGPVLAARLARRCANPSDATLVCTTPYFASVAERWPGPVVYWLTDLIARYKNVEFDAVRRLDERLCRVATLVCPASQKLADYLCEDAGCIPEKILVLPNATRAMNILPAPLSAPEPLPIGERSWTGPVAGVLGNLADNMDWIFLEELLKLTPWLTWAFVGPTSRPTEVAEQARARDVVMRHPQTRFLGHRPYGDLCHYARAFTVAVLPYRKREPTFSGSSTRFYEHLAAGHPIIATPGVAELREKEPLLRMANTPAEAASALNALRANGFEDGMRQARWEASHSNTWRARAATMQAALATRIATPRF